MGISYIYDPISIFSQNHEENWQVCEVPVEKFDNTEFAS